MAEALLLIGRGLQFVAAMLLFGAPLFGLYVLRGEGAGARLIRSITLAAVVIAVPAALLVLMGQAGAMSGADTDAWRPAAWLDVLTGTQFGKAWVLRLGLLAPMAAACLRRSSRWTYQPMAVIGGFLAASLAWMGHGAADEGVRGLVHLVADMAHLLAAAAWLGALVALFCLTVWASRSRRSDVVALARRALERFSGLGTAAVAVLVASGVANGVFLIGRRFPAALVTTPYGRILSFKLVLFAGMLALAALHRWRSTPRMAHAIEAGAAPKAELRSLQLSLALETALAIGVLAVVAWLGVIEPPMAAD